MLVTLCLSLCLVTATETSVATPTVPWDAQATGAASKALSASSREEVISPAPLAGNSAGSGVGANKSAEIKLGEASSQPTGDKRASATTLKLAPPKEGRSDAGPRSAGVSSAPASTVVLSLAAVLGLFFVCAWLFRRTSKANAPLPSDVIEVLGRAPFHGRQQLQLVRVGRKLLLVVLSPTGAETLTEIDNPQEVEQLIAACKQNQPGGVSATFQQILAQIERAPAPGGFLGRAGT